MNGVSMDRIRHRLCVCVGCLTLFGFALKRTISYLERTTSEDCLIHHQFQQVQFPLLHPSTSSCGDLRRSRESDALGRSRSRFDDSGRDFKGQGVSLDSTIGVASGATEAALTEAALTEAALIGARRGAHQKVFASAQQLEGSQGTGGGSPNGCGTKHVPK